MVGDNIGNTEIPSPFLKKEKNDIAYFPLKDGYIRDIEGNIVISDTVIEITYNHLSNLPHQYRWNILRTRWDKTESVNRFKKKYGTIYNLVPQHEDLYGTKKNMFISIMIYLMNVTIMWLPIYFLYKFYKKLP